MFTNQRDAAEIEGVYRGSELRYEASKHQYIPVAVLTDILIDGHYMYAWGLCVYTRSLAQLGKLQCNTLIHAVNAHYTPNSKHNDLYQVMMTFNDIVLGVSVGLFPISKPQIIAYLYFSNIQIQDYIRQNPNLPNVTKVPKVTLYGMTISQFHSLKNAFSYKLYVAKMNWIYMRTHLPRFDCRKIVGGLFSQKSWTDLRQWLNEHTEHDNDYEAVIRDNSRAIYDIHCARNNGQKTIDSKMPQRIQAMVKRLGIPELESRKERELRARSYRKIYRQQKQRDAKLKKKLIWKNHLEAVKRRHLQKLRIQKAQRKRRILAKRLKHDFSTLFSNSKLLSFYRQLNEYLSKMKLTSVKFIQLKHRVLDDIKGFSGQKSELKHCSDGDEIQRLAIEQAMYMMDLLNDCNELQINHPENDLKEICFKIRKLSAGVNKAMNRKLIDSPIVKSDKYMSVSKKLNHLQNQINGYYSKYDVWYNQQESRFSRMVFNLPPNVIKLQKRQLAMNQRRGLLHGYKSYGEQQMKAILDAHHIQCRHGYHLKNKLHLDFFLPEYSVGVEIDGEPHFHGIQYKDNYSLAEIRRRFDTQRKRDRAKNVYCRKHHLCLIRIQYIDENFLYIEWVQKHLLQKLSQLPKGRIIHVGNLYGFNDIVNSFTERK